MTVAQVEAACEAAPVAMASLSVAGELVWANARCCGLLGRSREELVGTPLSEFTHPADLLGDLSLFERVADGELAESESVKLCQRGDGRYLRLRQRLTTVPSEADAGDSFLIAILEPAPDSEEKNSPSYPSHDFRLAAAEREFAELERDYHFLAAHSSDLVLRATPDHIITFVSPACRTLLGYEPEELLGRNATEFAHPGDAGAASRLLNEAAAAPGDAYHRLRLRHKGGYYVWVESRVELVRDPATGAIQEIFASSRDITRQLETEAELRDSAHRTQSAQRLAQDSEERLRFTLDAAGVLLFEWDVQRDVIRRRLPGAQTPIDQWDASCSLEEAIALRHPEDREHFRACIRDAFVTGNLDCTTRMLRQDGAVQWLREAGRVVYDDSGKPLRIFGIGSDITAQKQAEGALRATRDAAESANRAKSHFMAVISHELRTPLTAIIGYSELLEMGVPVPLPAASREHVDRIRLSAQHLTQIIDEILTFSRSEAGREETLLARVELDELLREVVAIIEPLAKQKGLEFSANACCHNASVITDARKLRQILLNLLGNAVKFTDHGRVGLRLVAENGCLRAFVSDTGIGISAADQAHLFEPFWQADNSLTRRQGGTGLGLTVTHRLVDLLDGKLTVQSTEGRGTVFHLAVPAKVAGQASEMPGG